jgi:hypothetical protein
MLTLVRGILPLAISLLVVALPDAAAAQHGECDFPAHADAGHTDSHDLDTGPGDARTRDATIGDAAHELDTTTGCPSLGDPCGRTTAGTCGPDSDGCMHKTNGDKVCTCSCRTDRDCGPGGTCITVVGGSWCLPYGSPDGSSKSDDAPCAETACGPEATCRGGECVASKDTGGDEPTVVVFHDAPSGPEAGCDITSDPRPSPMPPASLVGIALIAVTLRLPR